MGRTPRRLGHGWAAALVLAAAAAAVSAADPKAAIPMRGRIRPEALAAILASKSAAPKPGLIHIGFPALYRQGHIPSSVFAGPAAEAEGLKSLRARVKALPRSRPLVLYCGCCPWGDCPNVLPAYKLLRDLGFKRVQVLEMKSNFAADWVDKGYPEVKGD